MASHQVIEQQYRKHPGQRLRQEDAKRRKAEDFGAGSLQPETQGRFVNAHKTARVKGNKEEIPPIVEHAPDRGSVIKITKTILPQLVEVHEDRDEHDYSQSQPS